MTCVGLGPDGEHCCQINGGDCEVLEYDPTGTPRCPFIRRGQPMKGNPDWERLPIARWFVEKHPGYDCADWPQRIPEVMANPTAGKCCWSNIG